MTKFETRISGLSLFMPQTNKQTDRHTESRKNIVSTNNLSSVSLHQTQAPNLRDDSAFLSLNKLYL